MAPNVASFVGTGTIREHVVGLDAGPPTPAQLDAMRRLVRRAMEEGALGVGSSLIYAPDTFHSPEDLIELAKVAARYRGRYITHMRSEGDRLLESVDETIRVAREAGIPAEIYHLKAAGEANWPKLQAVIEKVEAARREGLEGHGRHVPYTAGATGFDACLRPGAARAAGAGRSSASATVRRGPGCSGRCGPRPRAGRTSVGWPARPSGSSWWPSATRP